MKKLYLTVLSLMFAVAFSLGQESVLQISNTSVTPLDYCSSPVPFGNGISITGGNISGGLKISITNYKLGEDKLSVSVESSVQSRWDAQSGILYLSGNANTEEYQKVVRSITYTNLSPDPKNDTRHVAITLIDVDYLPSTKHFYRFIPRQGITWTNAKKEAETKKYFGLQGYLTTITSYEENSFIYSKLNGIGWIGATDELDEGIWLWATGPEAGTVFWRGNYNGSPAPGQYSFWGTGEPNNAYQQQNGIGEDYAHVTQVPDQPKGSWNDLRDGGDGPGSQYFYPQGYVIEFGGMPGEKDISLSASIDINIWNIEFDSKQLMTICEGTTVELNHEFAGNYEWFPQLGLDDPYKANPKASPIDTTTYKVVSRNGMCADSAYFTVRVKPAPKIDLKGDRNICVGDTARLDAGNQLSYDWNIGYDGQYLNVTETGDYKVQVMNQYQCYASDEVHVEVHSYPIIDLTHTDTLFCDSQSGTVKIEVDKENVLWLPVTGGLNMGSLTSLQTKAQVSAYGTYQTKLQVSDQYGCVTNDSLNLHFYKTPTSTFSIDSTECYGYNLKVNYTGDGSQSALYSWSFLDSLYAEGIGLQDLTVNLGFEAQDKRELLLRVSEHGCLSPIKSEHIRVVPNLTVLPDETDGCEPFAVRFDAATTEPVEKYTWYFGDGESEEGQTPTHTYPDDGFYDVGLRVISNEGCENYGLFEELIKVRPIPTVETDIDPNYCYPHQFEVNYTGSGNSADSYNWDLSELDAEEIIQNPGTTAGPLTVSLQNKPQTTIGLQVTSSFQCTSALVQFPVKRKPWVNLSASVQEGCPPLEVDFTGTQSDADDQLTYFWNFGIGDDEEGNEEATYLYDLPDQQFQVSAGLFSQLTGCVDTSWLEMPVQVYPRPIAGFMPDSVEKSIVAPVFNFSNLSKGANDYYWDFGDTTGISVEAEPSYRYSGMGTFPVELIATNSQGCADSVTHQVLVAFDRIFPPTGFSPNSSNPENRLFKLNAPGILSDNYQFQIRNRWGEIVFDSEDKDAGWDGKMKNGDNAPAGTYIWMVSYSDFLERNHSQSGAVTLVY